MSAGTPKAMPFHSYWGQYATFSDLPNRSGTPLSSPGEFDKLQKGDTAYNLNDDTLYLCTNVGGAGAAPEATWIAMGGANLIRDAHEIVVGFSAEGDVEGVDADFVDNGDGLRLQDALAAAGALNRFTDVRLRTGSVTLDSATAGLTIPLTLPLGIRLVGPRRSGAVINGDDKDDQRILAISGNNEILDVSFESPAPTAVTSGPVEGVLHGSGALKMERVNVDLNTDPATAARTQVSGLVLDPVNVTEIRDCNLSGESEGQGNETTAFRGLTSGRVLFDGSRVNGWDFGVFVAFPDIIVSDCDFRLLVSRCIECDFSASGSQGPMVSNSLFTLTDDLAIKNALRLINTSALQVNGGQISNCMIRRAAAGAGEAVRLENTGGGSIVNTILHGNVIRDMDDGIILADASVVEAIAVANNLSIGVTTAFSDSGAGTERAHNVI